MKTRIAICTACAVAVSWTNVHADPTDVCRAMVEGAAHNVGVTMSSSDVLDAVYSNYCEADGSTKDSGFNVGLSAIVEDIPVSLTGGAHDTQTQIKISASTTRAPTHRTARLSRTTLVLLRPL